ncbi:putative Delta(3,5)-Delta(2,4)-dienoyl-CoA isomerase, mitochondrial [Glarea lozoyensis 74030]|uniref:Putative Delta(3,5)-Delta(2,4)-dienoyl-CoA isomerase, mitochondrial n=1 Tax=Glarea lozoyensis (strain ATCC 74030 / MF5533) TaxID=1104152 RepID=H0ETI2_GLAL7|nr:putative Delta(3,5)-Delta(2,4)-dienoyl-CoA isomerase, mitochondrial [Glarea lozoyensis 74030]
MWLELKEVFDTLSLSSDVRAIILSGAGDRAFTSGLDVQAATVICVMHGITFGLGLDISTCADIRICSKDVKFAVKEVDIGLAADIGTLSRLPKVVGAFSWVKDVSLSARIFGGEEALRVGFVSYVLDNKAAALNKALELANLLAEKSPIAVQGTKELLNHARDNKLADSLRYTGVWNSAAIQTSDVERAMLSGLKKTKPRFEKL